jgi:hypothetical protein
MTTWFILCMGILAADWVHVKEIEAHVSRVNCFHLVVNAVEDFQKNAIK